MRRLRWVRAILGLAAMVLSTVVTAAPGRAAQPVPGNCPVSAADQAIDPVELELHTLVNNYRVQNGRAPLQLHQDLNRAAAWFARDMATQNYFPPTHVDLNGRDIPTRFAWCGIVFNAWRENIAAWTSGSATDAFNGWVNSPPHQTNMLATDVKSTGIARAFDPASTFDYYFVQTFTDSPRLPVADFDGSGTTDVAVYRPANGGWFVRNGEIVSWGIGGDVPVPGDYDGNGTQDMAVYRPGNGGWFIRNGATVSWGISGDIPVPADYDGDGDTDIAVYRPGNGGWFVNGSSPVSWGISGDIPVPGDYDGDGDDDIAVYRPGNGGWFIRNGPIVSWGISGDIPVPGDYNANGTTEIAVYRPGNGGWFVNGSTPVSWGISGDIPVVLPHHLRTFAGLPI